MPTGAGRKVLQADSELGMIRLLFQRVLLAECTEQILRETEKKDVRRVLPT